VIETRTCSARSGAARGGTDNLDAPEVSVTNRAAAGNVGAEGAERNQFYSLNKYYASNHAIAIHPAVAGATCQT